MQCQFHQFVIDVYNKDVQEKEDKKMWELYLSRVYDRSFSDWKQSIKSDMKKDDALETKDSIIHESQNILNGLKP